MSKLNSLENKIEGIDNRLFFQARNLAIEVVLLKIEKLVNNLGFSNIEVKWIESSNIKPKIEIRFLNKNKNASWEYGKVDILLNREKIKTYNNNLSDCYYSFKELTTEEYWRGRQPKNLLEFRESIKNIGEDYFKNLIERINYPFDRNSYSVY